MLIKHFENCFSKIPNVNQTNLSYFQLRLPMLTRPIFQFSAKVPYVNQTNFTDSQQKFPTLTRLFQQLKLPILTMDEPHCSSLLSVPQDVHVIRPKSAILLLKITVFELQLLNNLVSNPLLSHNCMFFCRL